MPESFEGGSSILTTLSWDIDILDDSRINQDKLREVLVRLYETTNKIILALNTKEVGFYDVLEDTNGQQYFPTSVDSRIQNEIPFRQVLRKVVDFGALPNTGTATVAHGITITPTTVFTRIYGCASDPSTDFIPLPYASPTLANNIELHVDSTNVIVTTGSDRTGYTECYVVLEYISY